MNEREESRYSFIQKLRDIDTRGDIQGKINREKEDI